MTDKPGRYELNPTDERDRLRKDCLALVWKISCQPIATKRLKWAKKALQTYAEYKNPPPRNPKPRLPAPINNQQTQEKIS